MKRIAASLIVVCSALLVNAQEPMGTLSEKRVPLTDPAIAVDASGTSALEATLRTTALNGAPDAPVTNVRIRV